MKKIYRRMTITTENNEKIDKTQLLTLAYSGETF